MAQIENITKLRKGKHLNFKEWSKIEAWKELNPSLSNREIAKRSNRSPQTIYTEVKDGNVRQIRRQVQHGKTYEYESFCYSATEMVTLFLTNIIMCRWNTRVIVRLSLTISLHGCVALGRSKMY